MMRVRAPKGHRTFDDDGVPLIWRMRVPLYGQGDAGLVWCRTIRNQLIVTQGFNLQSDADPSYFYKRARVLDSLIFLLVFECRLHV